MAKSRPEKRERKDNGQLPLPTSGPPVPSSAIRVLPMQLRVGDRLVDERGEWCVIGTPYTTLGGKTAHVRVELVAQPGVTEVRSWGAHERVTVKRSAGGDTRELSG